MVCAAWFRCTSYRSKGERQPNPSPIAIEIRRSRNVAGFPPATGGSPHTGRAPRVIPRAVPRPVNRNIRKPVAVEIADHRNISRLSELSDRDLPCRRHSIPCIVRRPKYNKISLPIAVKIRRPRNISSRTPSR